MIENNLMNVYRRYPVVFEKGSGAYLYDVDGVKYLDFVSGVAANSLGHCPRELSESIKNQVDKLIHISNHYYSNEALELSALLCENSPYNKVFFTNSGTEAIECAIKICKKHGLHIKRSKRTIVYMKNSFHGRTIGSLSITGTEKFKGPFRPLLPHTQSIEFNNIAQLRQVMNESIAGVFIEPIQGEGGVNTASTEFLKEARLLCDKYNALLVFDEIQCGSGRIGSFFCSDYFNVIPDITVMAKGLASGFPLGAVLTTENFSNVLEFGDHGTTFGGNPLACSAAFAVTETIKNEEFLKSVRNKSIFLKEKLLKLKDSFDFITELRGEGLLLGLKFTIDTNKIINECFKDHLLLVSAKDNVIRILPPLNISYIELDYFIDKFYKILLKFK